ncbi:YHYH domain-containing protein [Rosistilla oblonga]|uniref:SLA1 homology domain-containing protein n=1 Tax=Rosistilla oblonga TaxID=2527990 RepID=A0A518IM87_9BACT|nr:hypothetical protein Mal33_01340 [Rosistilla oblonga]
MGRVKEGQHGGGDRSISCDSRRRVRGWICRSALAFVFLIGGLSTCDAHSGGLDSNGGHRDSKNGGYHFHSHSPQAYVPTQNIVPAMMYRTPSYRTTARSSASIRYRSHARTRAKADGMYEDQDDSDSRAESRPSESSKIRRLQEMREPGREVKYLFHHVRLHPYEVSEFEENGVFWKVSLASGYNVNLRKSDIVRIDSVDPMDFRTWVDASGRFSTIAKYVDLQSRTLQLDRHSESGRLRIPLNRISKFDQAHVHKIKLIQTDKNR